MKKLLLESTTMITDWLEKNSDPEINKKIEESININIELPCKAFAYTHGFDDQYNTVTSITEVIVIQYDKKSGYCELSTLDGNYFPSIKITNLGFNPFDKNF